MAASFLKLELVINLQTTEFDASFSRPGGPDLTPEDGPKCLALAVKALSRMVNGHADMHHGTRAELNAKLGLGPAADAALTEATPTTTPPDPEYLN